MQTKIITKQKGHMRSPSHKEPLLVVQAALIDRYWFLIVWINEGLITNKIRMFLFQKVEMK